MGACNLRHLTAFERAVANDGEVENIFDGERATAFLLPRPMMGPHGPTDYTVGLILRSRNGYEHIGATSNTGGGLWKAVDNGPFVLQCGGHTVETRDPFLAAHLQLTGWVRL